MRRSPGWLLWLLLPIAIAGCDASGSTQGGTPLVADHCSDPNLGHTWTDLYTCYFGPGGKTSCVGQNFCHGGPEQTGALYPASWVCGTSRESCWQGTRQAQPVPGGVGLVCTNVLAPGDAGTESGASDAASDAGSSGDGGVASDAGEAGTPPVVCVVPSDPTTTRLWGALRGAGGVGLANMPYANQGTPGVTFTQQDLDRISAWIREGAQDN